MCTNFCILAVGYLSCCGSLQATNATSMFSCIRPRFPSLKSVFHVFVIVRILFWEGTSVCIWKIPSCRSGGPLVLLGL